MIARVVISVITLFLSVSLALGQAITVVKPESVGLSSGRIARLDKMLTQYANEKKVPGAVALISAFAGFTMVKFFGIVFLGQPREEKLTQAHDAGRLERIGLLWLGVGCILLGLFPNVQAFLLMGDVAIQAVNSVAVRAGEGRVIPAGSTYKIRGGAFSFRGARVFPSYLQAGPSFFIEKSKRRMIAEDIAAALKLVR